MCRDILLPLIPEAEAMGYSCQTGDRLSTHKLNHFGRPEVMHHPSIILKAANAVQEELVACAYFYGAFHRTEAQKLNT